VSESERLCHGDGSHEGGERCRRELVLSVLIREALVKAQPHMETLPPERTVVPLRTTEATG